MNFNLSITSGNSQSSIRQQLAGNAIHEVIFDGCEARDFAGQQDASKNFKVLEIKFSNKDGVFTHTVWEPRPEDAQERQGAFGPQPSNVMTMLYLFKHLIDAVNPEFGAQIDKKEATITASSWDALRQLMVEKTNPGKGTVTKIKLIKNNKGEAIFPYFLSYDRDGKTPRMTTNFIGDKIFFTTKELEKIKKSETAQPVNINTNTADPFALPAMGNNQSESSDDFNFEV